MMFSSINGRDRGEGGPTRRLRFDNLASIVTQSCVHESIEGGEPDLGNIPPTSPWLPRSHSGRRFVIVAVIAVLAIWGVLFLVFREWRARYRERAAYGISHVVPTIDPLEQILPPGVDPAEWRDAVHRTRTLLKTVTGSNLLGIEEMRALREELDQIVSRSRDRPEMALVELASVWNTVADRADFLFRDNRSLTGERHPRPKIVPSYGKTRVIPALDPLVTVVPPGVDLTEWRDAIGRTRAQVLRFTNSSRFRINQLRVLRSELDQVVDRAQQHPETAVGELARLWDSVSKQEGSLSAGDRSREVERFPRPEIFPQAPETPKTR